MSIPLHTNGCMTGLRIRELLLMYPEEFDDVLGMVKPLTTPRDLHTPEQSRHISKVFEIYHNITCNQSSVRREVYTHQEGVGDTASCQQVGDFCRRLVTDQNIKGRLVSALDPLYLHNSEQEICCSCSEFLARIYVLDVLHGTVHLKVWQSHHSHMCQNFTGTHNNNRRNPGQVLFVLLYNFVSDQSVMVSPVSSTQQFLNTHIVDYISWNQT